MPGHREVLGFCTEQRLAQIGEHLAPILGRRVRVSIQPPASTAGQADTTETANPAAAPTPGTERRAAMNLPLVQRVLEAFPDATLIDARDDAESPPPPPDASGDGDEEADAEQA